MQQQNQSDLQMHLMDPNVMQSTKENNHAQQSHPPINHVDYDLHNKPDIKPNIDGPQKMEMLKVNIEDISQFFNYHEVFGKLSNSEMPPPPTGPAQATQVSCKYDFVFTFST